MQNILKNRVYKEMSYTTNSSTLNRNYYINVYDQQGNLDSSIVKNCRGNPNICRTSSSIAFTYDSLGNTIDTNYYPDFGIDWKTINPARKNKKEFGDSLTIYYDSIGAEQSHYFDHFDPQTKIWTHYASNAITGKVSFRNVSRYNADGLLMVTTVHTGGEESYTINYIYNDRKQLIMRIRIDANREDEWTTFYEYLDNGLLKSSTSNDGLEVLYSYEYY